MEQALSKECKLVKYGLNWSKVIFTIRSIYVPAAGGCEAAANILVIERAYYYAYGI